MDRAEPRLRRGPRLRVRVPERREVQGLAGEKCQLDLRLPGHLPLQLGDDEGAVEDLWEEGRLVSSATRLPRNIFAKCTLFFVPWGHRRSLYFGLPRGAPTDFDKSRQNALNHISTETGTYIIACDGRVSWPLQHAL